MIKKFLRLIGNIISIIMIFTILISFFSLLHSMKDPDGVITILGHRSAVIISGSMQPFLNPGDMTISKVVNPNSIKVGDVITYRVESSIPITHRVVKIINQGGGLAFETKGDANADKDSEPISSDRVVGKLVYKIPKAGFISQFLKTKIGFTLVIIIPLILITIFELISIFHNEDKDTLEKGKLKR